MEGYNAREKQEYERARIGWYYAGKYGNSDPKKFPKRAEKFHPFPWDSKEHKKLSAAEIMERNRLANAQAKIVNPGS